MRFRTVLLLSPAAKNCWIERPRSTAEPGYRRRLLRVRSEAGSALNQAEVLRGLADGHSRRLTSKVGLMLDSRLASGGAGRLTSRRSSRQPTTSLWSASMLLPSGSRRKAQ